MIKRNRFKALCRKRKRFYQLQQRSSLVAARNNPQTFWRILRNNDIKHSSGTTISNKINPSQWYEYFSDLFSNNESEETETTDILSFIQNNYDNNDLNLPITEQEITQSIKSMKNNRSPLPDGIVIEMYKKNFTSYSPVSPQAFQRNF